MLGDVAWCSVIILTVCVTLIVLLKTKVLESTGITFKM